MSDFLQRERERRQQGPFRVGTVVAVSDTEGLDVALGGGIVTGLQKNAEYASPGVGDVVLVALVTPGTMVVMFKIGLSGAGLGPNLLPNPGFELGVAGSPPSSWSSFWGQGSTGVFWVDDEVEAHSSGASARFETASLASTQARRLISNDAVSVESGATYRVGGWFRGASADPNTTTQITVITAPTADGAQPFGSESIPSTIATSSAKAAWEEVAGVRTVPVGHIYMRVHFEAIAAAGHTTAYVYLDDASLRKQI